MHSFHELAHYVLAGPHFPSAKRDTVTDNETIEEWCGRRGIVAERDARGRFHFPISGIHIAELPEGYALKGGAARYLLRSALGLKNLRPPRDIDIVRTAEQEPHEGADNALAQTYMGNDYEHGSGVESVESIDDYFAERDLTINEILATPVEVIATEQAIHHTLSGVLRVTDFEWSKYNNVSHKMRAKMLRFLAESVGHCLEEEWDEGIQIPAFWLAVHLDRAMERGRHIAEEYLRELQERSQLPRNIQTPEAAARWLSERTEGFVFRNVSEAHMLDDAWQDMLYDIEDRLEKSRRHVKKA